MPEKAGKETAGSLCRKIDRTGELTQQDITTIIDLARVFARYPISLLIVHPRVRQDFYRQPVRRGKFERAHRDYPGPLCYNGGLTTPGDCAAALRAFPRVCALMLGQGLLRNPALIRQAKGGPAPTAEELRAFHDQLYHSYLEAFRSHPRIRNDASRTNPSGSATVPDPSPMSASSPALKSVSALASRRMLPSPALSDDSVRRRVWTCCSNSGPKR